MHTSSFENMEECCRRYVPEGGEEWGPRLTVLDIGAADVNGSYREIFGAPRFDYVGADMVAAPGVSVVMQEPDRIPLDDASFDLVVSGQMLEHCPRFWLIFAEMIRVLKPDGLLFLIAPSSGPIHHFPVDCYRFYPDAFRALAKSAGCHLIDLWLDRREPWRDLVGVFSKRPRLPVPGGGSGPLDDEMSAHRRMNWRGFGLLPRLRKAIRAGLSPERRAIGLASFEKPPRKLVRPNLFILGAGKCGTTSLHHALSGHPEIYLTRVKEPSFFSSGFQVVANPIEYFNLFPETEGKRLYGEASHVYFSAPEAAPVLRQLFPDARFLLMVRDPVLRAHSLYRHMRRYGHEPLSTFERALGAEDARFADPEFRADCPQYFWNYMYVRSSLYDLQLRRYLDLFPRRQFLVLTLGEWASEPERRVREIFRFLEVDETARVDVAPQNQAETEPALAAATRAALDERFRGLRERLEALVGRELRQWHL